MRYTANREATTKRNQQTTNKRNSKRTEEAARKRKQRRRPKRISKISPSNPARHLPSRPPIRASHRPRPQNHQITPKRVTKQAGLRWDPRERKLRRRRGKGRGETEGGRDTKGKGERREREMEGFFHNYFFFVSGAMANVIYSLFTFLLLNLFAHKHIHNIFQWGSPVSCFNFTFSLFLLFLSLFPKLRWIL